MSNAMARTRKVLFAAAVTAALAFGGTQAIATPMAKVPGAARTCDPLCAGICQGFGGEPTWGGCRCCG